MTLKLHVMTHFDTIFLVIHSFFSCGHFKFSKIARRPFMNMVYTFIRSCIRSFVGSFAEAFDNLFAYVFSLCRKILPPYSGALLQSK